MPVEDITLGNGDLYINTYHCGWLTGDVLAQLETEIKDFIAGRPRTTIVRVIQGSTFRLTASVAEIGPQNVARAMGQQAVTAITAAAAQTLSGQSYVLAYDRTVGTYYAMLGPGPGLATDFANVAFTRNSVAMVENTDYTIDPVSGVVVATPGGAMATGGTIVMTAGTYKRLGGRQIKVGKELSISDVLLHFVHTHPNTGAKVHVVMWRAAVEGNFSLNFQEEEFVSQEMAFVGQPLSTKADDINRGYIFWEDATQIADSTAPTLSSALPADADVAINSNIVWTFSEAVDPATVNGANFLVFNETASAYVAGALSLSVNNTVVTFNPTSDLPNSAVIRWTITTGLKDAAGNAIAALQTGDFTTVAA